jgi:hypothetical protein
MTVEVIELGFISNSLIVDYEKWEKINSLFSSGTIIASLDLVAVVHVPSNTVFIIKSRFFETKTPRQAITFENFKLLCKKHLIQPPETAI